MVKEIQIAEVNEEEEKETDQQPDMLQDREQWDLSGDIIDCFRRYSSELSPEEQEEDVYKRQVYAYMNDGSVRKFDVKPLIKKGGVFKKIEDKEIFKNTLTVLNGTVAWDIAGNRNIYKCIDIDPMTCLLYTSDI